MRTYLITGGANGIGRSLVKRLVEINEQVFFVDIDEENALQLITELKCEKLTFIKADLKSETDLIYIKDFLFNKKIFLDCIIHNACINKGGIENASYQDFKDVLDVGLVAPFYLSKLLLPLCHDQSSIIHISSTRAFQSQKNTETYSATKGGLEALTHAMAMSLQGKIRVNAIAPGWIDNRTSKSILEHQPNDIRQHPSKRIGLPDDILKAILYLSDPENSFINGQTIIVDGGMSKRMIYHGDEHWNYEE